MAQETASLGQRLASIRKRRGLTQTELATLSGVSTSYIRQIEQETHTSVRLETIHKLALALRVPTSRLATGPDAEPPEQAEVEAWDDVKQALEGRPSAEPAEEPTAEGLAVALQAAVDAVLESRFSELRAMLPNLLRDADVLVAGSVNGDNGRARQLRSRIRQMTAYMMGQTWQFDLGDDAISLAIDDAPDELTMMAAVDWATWLMLRQGRVAQAREVSGKRADDAEPRRISRATPEEICAWGKFLARASCAAVRDNRPGEASDYLRFARLAATALGKDIAPTTDPWYAFGPMTVAMYQAENAMIQDKPETVLKIGGQLTGRGYPVPRNWMRHRLDVAHAHTALHQYGDAMTVLGEVRAAAPQWLAQQRYARDVLGGIIEHRRTLTPEMRELADFMHVPY